MASSAKDMFQSKIPDVSGIFRILETLIQGCVDTDITAIVILLGLWISEVINPFLDCSPAMWRHNTLHKALIGVRARYLIQRFLCITFATEVLNISKHSWPLPDHHGSPGIMKDHDGLFQGLSTFHHGRPKLADPWWSVMKIVTVWLGLNSTRFRSASPVHRLLCTYCHFYTI